MGGATYRTATQATDLFAYRIKINQSDLFVLTPHDRRKEAFDTLLEVRASLESYLKIHEEFATSLVPLEPKPVAPDIVKEMCWAAKIARVGPMAAVAGAIAQAVGERLFRLEKEVIVENGGDIFLKGKKKRTIALYAGDSPLSMKIGIRVSPEGGLGVCSSSAKVGHSLSFGCAHCVTVITPKASLSDALATHLGNLVKKPKDVESVLLKGASYPFVKGIVVIVEDKLGAWGEIELVNLKAWKKL